MKTLRTRLIGGPYDGEEDAIPVPEDFEEEGRVGELLIPLVNDKGPPWLLYVGVYGKTMRYDGIKES